MSSSNPTRPNAPDDEVSSGHGANLPDARGPTLKDPRSQAAMDNIGVENQSDLLDIALDGSLGDVDPEGRSFADDVRSDRFDNEGSERR